jgi:hypothetical protein
MRRVVEAIRGGLALSVPAEETIPVRARRAVRAA